MSSKIYSLIVIILSIINISILNQVDAINRELPLFGRVIFVDPGHGGRDPGAMYGKLYEKDIVLEISNILRDKLLEKGAIVYMTREDDSDLSSKWDPKKKRGDLYRRILMYKKKNTELYLSIHLNSSTSSTDKGIEVLYNPINKENKVFGTILMDKFKEELGSNRILKKTDLYMYKNTTVPGVLIECGFLSNPNERYKLQTTKYQQKLSEIITDSVIMYFNK